MKGEGHEEGERERDVERADRVTEKGERREWAHKKR